MRPATGWMPYLTVTPRSSRALASSRHGVLRLRGGQSVAGNEDDLVGVGEAHGGVVQRDLAHLAARACGGGVVHRAEAAEQHVGDRAVHRLAHQDREDEAGEAVERAGDDEHVVAEHEAGGGRGQAGVAVQQRHHHRHVGRADGDDQHDAEEESEGHHGVEESEAAGL